MDKNKLIAVIIIIIIIALLGNKILNEILEALNLKDTKEEAAEKARQAGAERTAEAAEYWKPTYAAKGPKGQALLTYAAGDAAVKKIDGAIGYLYDNEEKVEAVFNGLKTKSQLSNLAYHFNRVYGKDLYGYLEDKLDTAKQKQTLTRIIERMAKLPAYYA